MGLLGGVASSGHSDTEVAAFCRAAYTPEMCGTLRASLGKMPWSEAKIQDACQQWDAGIKTRGMLSYDELNQALEGSAKTKANLGYNMPRNSDGTVNIDQSVQMKLSQTQSMVDAYNQYMGYTTLPPSGAVGSAGAAVAAVSQKLASRDVSGLWKIGHKVDMTAAVDARIVICGALAAFAMVSSIFVGFRIVRFERHEVVSLLEDVSAQE